MNWQVILTVLALALLALAAYGLPTIPKIKEWLLQAVTEAEKLLGSDTGQLKLSTVYNWFVASWGLAAKLMPFTVFSWLVDKALETMRELLESSTAAADYVKGELVLTGLGVADALPVGYDDLTDDALRRLAAEAGVENYTAMDRAALIAALKEADA